jgi:hypothetical protein
MTRAAAAAAVVERPKAGAWQKLATAGSSFEDVQARAARVVPRAWRQTMRHKTHTPQRLAERYGAARRC